MRVGRGMKELQTAASTTRFLRNANLLGDTRWANKITAGERERVTSVGVRNPLTARMGQFCR